MNHSADIDYCGIVMLLRQLLEKGLCTPGEAEKIAARLRVRIGAEIFLPL